MEISSEQYRRFYETWAALREDPVEADYLWQASCWKWTHLEGLIRRHLAPASVLEFGCGSGEMLELVRGSFPEADLHGIDISERMLSMARERLGEAKLIRGAEDALEQCQRRVDLALAIDILEHLIDPIRVIQALGAVGRFVAFKIPLERRRIRLGLSKQKVGTEHAAGHLHFWTLGQARRMLGAAGLSIIEGFTADPPESVRYHPAVLRQEKRHGPTPLGLLRATHHAFETTMERLTCRRASRLHRLMFGSNLFVLAGAKD